MQKADYIIVGGGISGIFISHLMRELGKSVLLFNHLGKPAAAAVAAGTWNPLVFKKYTLSWRFEEFHQSMQRAIQALELLLQEEFFQALPIQKVITSEDDLAFWKKRANDPSMQQFMLAETKKAAYPAGANLANIHNGGRINLKALLKSYHEFAAKEGFLINENFNYEALNKKGKGWTYQNYEVERVIFCEGAHVSENPFFNWIPLKPANGDTITIFSPQLKLNSILKKNIFILPLGDDKYQVGATYNWENLSWTPSEKARQQIEEKLQQLINVPYQVIGQEAGVRPTAYDRRPIVGEHPEQKGLFVFNGLGTKGVLIGPRIAEEFVDFLENGTALDQEVDLKRCLKFYPS